MATETRTDKDSRGRTRKLHFNEADKLLEWFDELVLSLETAKSLVLSEKRLRGTDIFDGQIKYYKHQISTINWLAGMIRRSN